MSPFAKPLQLCAWSAATFFVWSTTASSAPVPPPDPGPLETSIYSLQDELFLPIESRAPDFLQRLAAKRREALEYTRCHLHEPLDRFQWEIPLYAVYNWSLTYNLGRSYAQSKADVRELFDLLRTVPNFNKSVAVGALAVVIGSFMEKWADTGYFPDALRLFDEVEQWVFSDPVFSASWHSRAGGFHARAIANACLFAPAQRDAMLAPRRQRLLRLLADAGVPPRSRTNVLAQWANALYLTGHEAAAADLMDKWWQQHREQITDLYFYMIWMKIIAFGQQDLERAGRLLEHVLALPENPVSISQLQMRKQIAAFYNNALLLPAYEIRRLRYVQAQEYNGQMEQIRLNFEKQLGGAAR